MCADDQRGNCKASGKGTNDVILVVTRAGQCKVNICKWERPTKSGIHNLRLTTNQNIRKGVLINICFRDLGSQLLLQIYTQTCPACETERGQSVR